jgi:acyl carrier protein
MWRAEAGFGYEVVCRPRYNMPFGDRTLAVMVDRKAVLDAMAEFFAENFPNIPKEKIESLKAGEVIQQSLDLVEFVLHLEEKLGIEININTLGEKLITKTFGELADDLAALGNRA